MSTPRVRCLSCRVSEDVYTRLAERARAAGATLPGLVAHLLTTGAKTCPPASQATERGTPRSVPAIGLDRLVEQDEELEERMDIPCPACAAPEVMYLESARGPDGAPPVTGFGCTQCGWAVTDHAAHLAAGTDEASEPEPPSSAHGSPPAGGGQ